MAGGKRYFRGQLDKVEGKETSRVGPRRESAASWLRMEASAVGEGGTPRVHVWVFRGHRPS